MAETLPDELRLKASSNQVSSDLGGEVVILDLGGSKYFGLDGVGAKVWELLQSGATVRELREAVLSEYEVDPETCRRDIDALIAGLEEKGLVVRPE